MDPVPTRLSPPFLSDPRLVRLFDVIEGAGGEARVVGGAVRNTLLAVPVEDIDLATTLAPELVAAALERAGLRAVPTGIEHGTVTAVVDHMPVEVTTLRHDVETDGRRAVVAFTTDWEADATRRDFTINALFMDRDGRVFDYTGGIADCAARRVRFIGNPHERIREDYLRILRLFRFHAWYGHGEIDTAGVTAAIDERAGLRGLSGERIWKELARLLAARDPAHAVDVLAGTGLLDELLPGPFDPARLRRAVELSGALPAASTPIVRLAALAASDGSDHPRADELAARLRLSNGETHRLRAAIRSVTGDPPTSPREVRAAVYGQGRTTVLDSLALAAADGRIDPGEAMALSSEVEGFEVPRLPVAGRDLLALGLAPGPAVGALLAELEARWIASDFSLGRDRLLADGAARIEDVADGDRRDGTS